MDEAKVLVSRYESIVAVRIIGRASFKVSTDLRSFAEKVLAEGVGSIVVDLAQCISMDSTFMGVLAMIGLKGHGKVNLVLVNATEAHRELLDGIGVSMVWRYAGETVPETDWQMLCKAAAGAADSSTAAATILDAHRCLMELDPANVPKFRNVVDMVAKELGKARTPLTGDTDE